jgi:hypothetical protein
MLSPVREEPQNLFSLKFMNPSKRWNFENRTESAESRASERNGPYRRIMSAPCRVGVRSSNEKSLPLLGLIARKITRRIRGFGQGGGGRGTGIEPSPRSPTWWKVIQRKAVARLAVSRRLGGSGDGQQCPNRSGGTDKEDRAAT